jgi:hypothetical protein
MDGLNDAKALTSNGFPDGRRTARNAESRVAWFPDQGSNLGAADLLTGAESICNNNLATNPLGN